MTWTNYGPLHQLLLPHGRIEIHDTATDDNAHRWRVELYTDGNRRYFETTGYLHAVKVQAYRDLMDHYRRTYENLEAMHAALVAERPNGVPA